MAAGEDRWPIAWSSPLCRFRFSAVLFRQLCQPFQHFLGGGKLILKGPQTVALLLNHLGGEAADKRLAGKLLLLRGDKTGELFRFLLLSAISAGTSINSARSTYTSMPATAT